SHATPSGTRELSSRDLFFLAWGSGSSCPVRLVTPAKESYYVGGVGWGTFRCRLPAAGRSRPAGPKPPDAQSAARPVETRERNEPMVTVPEDLRQRLRQQGQEHVLAWWDELNEQERQGLLGQLRGLDLDQLQGLYADRDKTSAVPPQERIV